MVAVSLYTAALMIPVYMQNIKHASALDTGLVMLPGTLLMAVGSPIAGKLYNKIGPLRLLFAGILMIVVGTWELSHIGVETPIVIVTVWLSVRYAGIAISLIPATNVGMSSVPKELSGHASAVSNWIRQGTAALSVGIFSSLLSARTSAHMEQLADSGRGTGEGIKELAWTLSMQDAFVVSTVIIAIALPFIFKFREKRNIKQVSL